ncbi:MAG: hypothetical protein QOG03_1363 [Actinomycetota bacterium]|jgi:CrcB protein|nr:hypothetical protein [Actinomycetota bacterium]
MEPVVPIDPDAAAAGPAWSAVAAVALGGALGAPARYEVAKLVPTAVDAFPWATFWTNVGGAFALGLFLVVIIERFPPSRYLRPFVAVGFLGAFTTFSTFAVETDLLVKDGHAPIALAYVVASLVAGLGAATAGMTVGRLGRLGRRGEER